MPIIELDELDHNGQFVGTRSIRLCCRVEWFRLGGHDGRQIALQNILSLNPEKVVLTHGSSEAFDGMADGLAESGQNIEVFRSDRTPEVEIDL